MCSDQGSSSDYMTTIKLYVEREIVTHHERHTHIFHSIEARTIEDDTRLSSSRTNLASAFHKCKMLSKSQRCSSGCETSEGLYCSGRQACLRKGKCAPSHIMNRYVATQKLVSNSFPFIPITNHSKKPKYVHGDNYIEREVDIVARRIELMEKSSELEHRQARFLV